MDSCPRHPMGRKSNHLARRHYGLKPAEGINKWIYCIYTCTHKHTHTRARTFIYTYIIPSDDLKRCDSSEIFFLSASLLSLSLYFSPLWWKEKFLLAKLITHQSKCCIRRVTFLFFSPSPPPFCHQLSQPV